MSIFRKPEREDFIIIAVHAHLSMTEETNSILVPLIEQHKPTWWELQNPDGYMIGFRSTSDSSHSRADSLVQSIQDILDTNPHFTVFTVGRSEGPLIVEFDWRGRVTVPPMDGTVSEAMKNGEQPRPQLFQTAQTQSEKCDPRRSGVKINSWVGIRRRAYWIKQVIITALLVVITAGLGLYGIQGWTGTSGGHWVGVFGLTLILPAMWTRSWILGALVHIGFWICVVWGVFAICRTIRSIKKEITRAAEPQVAMREYGRLLIISVLVTLALGGLGFAVTPIGINILGFVLFWWHPNYGQAQGLGSGFFYLSLMLPPLGALYGVVSGILMSVAGRRWREKKRRIGTVLAVGYLALLVAIVLVLGLLAIM